MSAYRNAGEKKRGVEVWLSCPAKRLITDANEGVIGVVAETEGKPVNIKARKGVILATGGYEYDPETKQNFNLESPIYALGCPGNTGDRLRMTSGAGAGL